MSDRYELVAGDDPGDLSDDRYEGGECQAYAAEPVGRASRDGDVVCSRPAGHEGAHFDGWCREAWEAR